MNKNNYKAFLENDIIANNFITAILEFKVDALKYGNSGLTTSNCPLAKDRYYYIADEWLKYYFANFSDMDYEYFKKVTAVTFRRSSKLKIK